MTYWALADLQNLIGVQVVEEIFDDNRQGFPNAAQLAQVQTMSDAMVDGALARVYPGPFPIVQNFSVWTALTGYAIGSMVVPPTPTGLAYRAIGVAGTSGAAAPAWPTVLGGTVVDATVTWVAVRLIPELVFTASLLWGKALAYEKHPEYVRMYGRGPRKEAEEYLDRLVAARAYLIDALALTRPNNVGGAVYTSGPRMTLDQNGESGTGDF